MPSPLIRTYEAAEFLHCSRKTIRNLIDCGELDSIDIGSAKVNGKKRQRAHLRITVESMNRYARKHSLHFGK